VSVTTSSIVITSMLHDDTPLRCAGRICTMPLPIVGEAVGHDRAVP
jgi:hypothetical protein